MAKAKLNLVPVSYRITKEQKLKVKKLSVVEQNSESGIVRDLINKRKAKPNGSTKKEVVRA